MPGRAPAVSEISDITRTPRERKPVSIPPILLEGDREELPLSGGGRGERYALGPTAPAPHSEWVVLPEAYGTERLFLTARDPFCVYAAWDLTSSQADQYRRNAYDGKLWLRVHEESRGGPIVQELEVPPDSRSAFVDVERPGTTFVSEIGFFRDSGEWKTIATSGPARTPPADRSPDLSLDVATVPAEVSLPALAEAVQRATEVSGSRPLSRAPAALESAEGALGEPQVAWESTTFVAAMTETPGMATAGSESPAQAVSERLMAATAQIEQPASGLSAEPHREAAAREPAPLLKSLPELRSTGWSEHAELRVVSAPPMTPAQAEAMAQTIWPRQVRRTQVGSLELSEWESGVLPEAVSSAGLVQPEAGVGPLETIPLGGVSSPAGVELKVGERARQFWMRVNAELIIYGSTEPHAHVAIAGRPIRLRSDGTFSFRFALPDGEYPLRIEAVAPDGKETRAAALRFTRQTAHEGDVGVHPTDRQLTAPNCTEFA